MSDPQPFIRTFQILGSELTVKRVGDALTAWAEAQFAEVVEVPPIGPSSPIWELLGRGRETILLLKCGIYTVEDLLGLSEPKLHCALEDDRVGYGLVKRAVAQYWFSLAASGAPAEPCPSH